ncbi:hypothetical protein [Stenotrophomonas sp. S39]|uniref:hypothetical protein n=1 Tax=Stenotrophomonas sp. S39 TaxID=2767451 RepID=UPI00190CE069|nr:hypothetical protein [Stenotrophomonas sp. S39]MBK0052634.1 hypothetical protein [Stenotrophomonas sp. S39]
MQAQEDWYLKIRARDVTVRVVLAGIGRGTMTSFHVMYGPSQAGLEILVESYQDAMVKTESLLSKMMGEGWY